MGKTGICLVGGGARGSYQIGVWKALIEFGIDKEINVYSGTSVGSLNAALIAQDDFNLAKRIWLSIDKDILHEDANLLKRLYKEHFKVLNNGIYSTKKIENLILNNLNFDSLRQKEIYITTSYKGRKEDSLLSLLEMNYKHYFEKKNQIEYNKLTNLTNEEVKNTLLASCAIPIIFSPVDIKGRKYYDGGIFDNKPIKPLVDAGCDRIIVVNLFRHFYRKVLHADNVEFITIKPSRSLGGILDFRKEKILNRYELGYYDACNVLNEYYDEVAA